MPRQTYTLKKKTEAALAAAWDYINRYYDAPAFIQLLDWKIEGQKSIDMGLNKKGVEESVPLIKSIELWKSKVMYEYLMVKKPSILSGNTVSLEYDMCGPPPVSFTDIYLTVNVSMRPLDWVTPDVTSYLANNK
jgi:hypothetical protein